MIYEPINTNILSLMKFVESMNEMRVIPRAILLSRVEARGLMLPRGIFSKIFTWLAKPSSDDGSKLGLVYIHPSCLKFFEARWRSMTDHLLDGKDLSDPTSVGGFNQNELDQIYQLACAIDAAAKEWDVKNDVN